MDLGLCQKIAKYIMRPPRTTYQIQDLGPDTFQHRNILYERIDFKVINQRKLRIQCSLFRQKYKLKKRPVIIFLHANSSSRLAVKNYLPQILPFFDVACFDSSGSGLSQGRYVTLGYYEKQDLRSLVRHLKSQFQKDTFILWGRSMGSVTSLLYAGKYKDISAVICDNAFSDLEQTCKQLKQNFLSILPDFLLDSILQRTQQYMDEQICKQQSINFNIKRLKPKQIVDKIKCPIYYIYSQSDRIVNNRHSKVLYEKSNYPKRIMSVKGDHNGNRDGDIKGKVVDFLVQFVLQKQINHRYLGQSKSEIRSSKQADLVYQSPLDKRLCQSYLKNKRSLEKLNSQNQQQQRCDNIRLSELRTQIYERNDKDKLPVRRESLSKTAKAQTSPNRQEMGLGEQLTNQYKYQVESFQFGKFTNSCFDNCQNQRKRKKIFYNN